MTTLRTAAGRSCFAVACIASALLGAVGCQSALEDGYVPHPLGASPDIRRSYYASPFTEQAEPRAAQNQGAGFHKPGT
jgi:hypothetical protein